MQVPPFIPPKKGDLVGEYRIEEVLGEGGFGFVYKVERAGLFFALKLLRARALEGWGQREINILRHLELHNVVRFHAYDRWPVPVHGYLYFVMEYVEGRTLEVWALDENPSPREVARLLLELLLALAEVHKQGVFHRDLKLDNILIRDSDSRPILVDFGIGWLAGGRTVTRDTLPPGTYEYRSPEAIRFERDPANKGSTYRPDEGDDLWAIGVVLYWLLTDVLPFGTRHQGGLYERILTVTPKAPREVNPRVPEALSDLCMRMLQKERSARFPSCAELCGALDAALASAELDGRWDLPLIDPDAPDRAPTALDPDNAPRDAEQQEALQWNLSRPRRGRKAAKKALAEGDKKRIPEVGAPAPLQADAAPAGVQVAEGPAPSPEALVALLADVPPALGGGAVPPPVAEAAGPAAQPAASPPEVVSAPPVAVPPAPGALKRGLSRLLPSHVGVLPVRSVVTDAVKPAANVAVVVLAVVALASAAAFVVRPREAPAPPPAQVPTATRTPEAFLPDGLLTGCPIPRTCPVSELATSPEAVEAGGGAAPLPPTPAPPTAMARKQDSRSIPQEQPAPAPLSGNGLCKKYVCVAGACGWVFIACPAAQVRGTPGAEDCPPGAVDTMRRELRLPLGSELAVNILPGGDYGDRATVRAGFGSIDLAAQYGELPEGTMLTGDFILGETRLYGRFKQAQTPEGATYPVCIELEWNGRGVPIEANTGPDTARVQSRVGARTVSSFE